MSSDAPGAVARDLLGRDCQLVLEALAATVDPHDAIHSARKAIRRMRALLALLDEDDFDLARDDLALRRLGKGLSDMRDAHVVVEAAARLQKADGADDWNAIITALAARREHILRRALASDPDFARRRSVVEQVLSHVQQQPWERLRRSRVRTALARSERRVVKAAARAAHDGDDEAVHRWRRRARRLRMQLDAAHALGAVHGHAHGNGAVARKAKALHKVSDRLGALQDLRLLRNLVRNLPATMDKTAALKQIGAELETIQGAQSRVPLMKTVV
jgi:hypothetical protein